MELNRLRNFPTIKTEYIAGLVGTEWTLTGRVRYRPHVHTLLPECRKSQNIRTANQQYKRVEDFKHLD
jgi:hypothetical protein